MGLKTHLDDIRSKSKTCKWTAMPNDKKHKDFPAKTVFFGDKSLSFINL